MKYLSCFTDEAGEQNMHAGYYIATLVFHDQSQSISEYIERYMNRLSKEDLPDIPFHGVDLLHGHDSYENMSVADRKRLLVAFAMFVRTLPVSFHSFIYKRSNVHSSQELEAYLRRDIVNFVFEHLEKFQSFDIVAIYYDDGHQAVSSALHGAFDYALSKNAIVYKELSHKEKRLAQVADYLCTLTLAQMRFEENSESKTYSRFFGTQRNLKQNYLKQVQKKRI